LADLVADGLPTFVVTHQLQVERRTGKVRRSQTDVLPLCHATNQTCWKACMEAGKHDTTTEQCRLYNWEKGR